MRPNYNFFSLSLLLTATFFLLPLILCFPHATASLGAPAPLRKDERWPLVSSEFGEISAVKISDGRNGSYHLQFITMNPHSLFLPVHLYSEMIFYVNSGSGTLSWIDIKKDDNKLQQVKLQSGDVFRLQSETVFYLENDLLVAEDQQQLQIYAIFTDSQDDLLQNKQGDGVYTSVRDLMLGFDNVVLQAALNVREEVIEELRAGESQPLIVQGIPGLGSRVMSAFLATKNSDIFDINSEKEAYNIREADHDVENCYGWSTTVTRKQLDVFKHTDFSVFMVNLTKGSMMGPHWNPRSAEVGIVVRGQGMVQLVCPNKRVCTNSKFRVAEGDVFVVPKYHPMTQISFDNGSFVFVGFTMTSKDNLPRYLVGELSILQTLDKSVLGRTFNVSNATMDQVLSAQKESIILDCTSCAEDIEERVVGEDVGRGREGGRAGGGEGRQEAESRRGGAREGGRGGGSNDIQIQ